MQIKHFSELAKVVADIDNTTDAKNFLSNILTPQELDEVVLRLQIFKRLMAKVPQREIATELGVSISTVTRGSRELQYGKPGVAKILGSWWSKESI